MPDVVRRGVTMSEAVQEAAAIAPIGRVMLYTYELWHDSLVEPIRFVNDVIELDAALEADAPRSPGEFVNFMACPLSVKRPEESDTAASPTVELSRPDVGGLLKAALDTARGSVTAWTLIERLYASDDLTGPALMPPLNFELTSADVSAAAGKISARYDDDIDESIPHTIFKASEYPGLQR